MKMEDPSIRAKISTALADSRLNLAMAAILSFCRNVGAISWVPVRISTIYWGTCIDDANTQS